jgi:hypothetical protein
MHAAQGSLAVGLAMVVSACTAHAEGALPSTESNSSALGHPSAGYLEHARSPLVPFCHGVLVAPDVVVTSAVCVEDGWWELSFGVGEVGTERIPVDEAFIHPLADDPRHGLAALVLERAVRGVEPASLMDPDGTPCGVEIPSYEVALRGDDAERSVWTACGLAPDEEEGAEVFVMTDGYPNCHGDSGAGAFVPDSGAEHVIGFVTRAGHLGPPHPLDPICVTDVELASVRENRTFLDEAIALSRVGLR